MKEIYVPVHYLERDSADDDLIKLVLPDSVEQVELEARLSELVQCYQNGNDNPESGDGYDSPEEMTEDIFSTLMAEYHGVREYCTKTKPITIE